VVTNREQGPRPIRDFYIVTCGPHHRQENFMSVRKFPLIASAVMTTTLVLTSSQTVQAESPNTVCRVFGMFYGPENPPDLEGPGSIALISHAVQETGVVRFQVHENNGDLSGMRFLGGEGTLVSIGGATTGTQYWLDNEDGASILPPSGSRAVTGSEGDVYVLGNYFVTEVTDGCGSNCGWRIIGVDDRDPDTPEPPGTTSRFVLAFGFFSK
jgi:hypothetical protein